MVSRNLVSMLYTMFFKPCPQCGKNQMATTQEGVFIDRHLRCLECLGLDHDPDKCVDCRSLDRSTLAKREIQKKAWAISGQFLSRSKSLKFLKEQGLLKQFHASLSASFKESSMTSTVVEDTPSVLPVTPVSSQAVEILAGSSVTTQPILSYGDSVQGSVEVQPILPQANSTMESLASAFREESTVYDSQVLSQAQESQRVVPVQDPQPSPVHLPVDPQKFFDDMRASLLESLAPLFKVPEVPSQALTPSLTGVSPPVVPSGNSNPSSVSGIQSTASTLVTPTKEVSHEGGSLEVEKEESLDLKRVVAINSASEGLASAMGLKVVDKSVAPGLVQTLSLFARRKPKMTTLYKAPPEFLQRDKQILDNKVPRVLVPPQSSQVFRLEESDWASLCPDRVPDDLLLTRTNTIQKSLKKGQSVHVLADKLKAGRVEEFKKIGDAATHSLRLASVSASLSQFAVDTMQTVFDKYHLPQELKDTLISVQSASQLSLSATAESAEIQSRTRAFAAHKERDLWVDSARVHPEVKLLAKSLPLPIGSYDSDSNKVVQPLLLGDKFKDLMTAKYKTIKYADKVSPDFRKRKPSFASGASASKKAKSSFVPHSSSSKDQSFRGRGKGRGSKGRGRGFNSGVKPDFKGQGKKTSTGRGKPKY